MKSVRGLAVRGYVRTTLNSTVEQELRDRKVEGRANGTSSA